MTQATDMDAPEGRTTFNIPEANWAKFLAKIEKLSRRSVKLIGQEITPFVFGYDFLKDSQGRDYKVIQVLLTAEVPRVDGWTFVARLDHSQEAGTLIRMVPNSGVKLPERYRNCQPNCDHCKVRRQRRDTFVLCEEATGTFQQVGSTCLVDFFGHDPSKMAAYAELLGYATETGRGFEELTGFGGMYDRRYVDLEEYLGHAARSVRQHKGYVSMKAVREAEERGVYLTSTREDAYHSMYPVNGDTESAPRVLDEDRAVAAAALEFIRVECQKPNLSDYMHNVSVIAHSEMIESRHCGIAASIIFCYLRHVERSTPRPAAISVDMQGIVALFNTAKSKLKNPAIVLLTQDAQDREVEIKLTVAGAKARIPGSVNVTDLGKYPDNQWFGRINLDGTFNGTRSAPAGLNDTLLALSADPVKVATEYGRKTGNCCFCRKALKDARSTEVGYGSTCASNYGLAWGSKAAKQFAAEEVA
jgi:hypothetical protein